MKFADFLVREVPEDPRLDKLIPLHLPDFSRSSARKLIEAGAVYVNGKRCRMNSKMLKTGDKIRIALAREKENEEEFRFHADLILFENDDWIVVNKPPGLPTHETIDSSRNHLLRSLQIFMAERARKQPAQIYLGIHHRLDRDTSGALLFTKRKEANPAVAQAFQDRTVSKTYLAISRGRLDKPLVIKSFLGPSPRNKRVFCSVERDGKYAETEVRALEQRKLPKETLCLVEARPKTGRTHQIRVHLAENGLPILGDKTYGVEYRGAPRVMLHAWKLELLGHNFRAPLPDDFRSLDFHEPKE